MRKFLFTLSLLVLTATAHASDFGIALSDKAIALDYTGRAQDKSLEFTMGWLHHMDNGDVATAGIQVSQKLDKNARVNIGMKGVGIFNDFRNASALALGGGLNLNIPAAPKLYVGVSGWFAPNVTSFNGASSYQDFGGELGYQIINNAAVFVGYRFSKIKYDKDKYNNVGVTMQDGPLVGLRLTF